MGGTRRDRDWTAAMRALRWAFQKSWFPRSQVETFPRYVDISDILMFPSIVDVSGPESYLARRLFQSCSNDCGYGECEC